MGRTGKWWACDHFNFEPDILNVAKGIASGLPLSAVVARADLMTWKPGAHASTFGGNPVAVAAALATIELLEDGLIDNAARVGAHMMRRMSEWPTRRRIVGDVRGLGSDDRHRDRAGSGDASARARASESHRSIRVRAGRADPRRWSERTAAESAADPDVGIRPISQWTCWRTASRRRSKRPEGRYSICSAFHFAR